MKQSMKLHFFRQSIITGLHFPEDLDGHQGLDSEYILSYSSFFLHELHLSYVFWNTEHKNINSFSYLLKILFYHFEIKYGLAFYSHQVLWNMFLRVYEVIKYGWWKIKGLPWWLSSQESTCQYRRLGFNPWVRKIPWRSKWQPTPVFLPGKSYG